MSTLSKLTGGAFLFEKKDTADLFIPEEFTEEQLMISSSVKEFMIKEVHGLGIEKVASLDAEKDKDLVMEIFHKASEPEPGSVRQYEQPFSPLAIPGRYLVFCASVPYQTIGNDPIDV